MAGTEVHGDQGAARVRDRLEVTQLVVACVRAGNQTSDLELSSVWTKPGVLFPRTELVTPQGESVLARRRTVWLHHHSSGPPGCPRLPACLSVWSLPPHCSRGSLLYYALLIGPFPARGLSLVLQSWEGSDVSWPSWQESRAWFTWRALQGAAVWQKNTSGCCVVFSWACALYCSPHPWAAPCPDSTPEFRITLTLCQEARAWLPPWGVPICLLLPSPVASLPFCCFLSGSLMSLSTWHLVFWSFFSHVLIPLLGLEAPQGLCHLDLGLGVMYLVALSTTTQQPG